MQTNIFGVPPQSVRAEWYVARVDTPRTKNRWQSMRVRLNSPKQKIEWVDRMNNIRNRAAETVNSDLIYT